MIFHQIHPQFGRIKLGRRRSDPQAIARVPKYKAYRIPEKIAVPPEVSWVTKVPSWPMFLNDQLGDCVIAAMLHMIQQWNFYAGRSVTLSDQDALSGYEAIGGYVPGDPTTDNGCDMLTALEYWRKTGIAGHKILGYIALDPTNLSEIFEAIYLFGNAFAGLALPISCQRQTAWTVADGGPNGSPNNQPDSWGGHCVPYMAASPESITFISWAQRLKQSHNFNVDYCDELYAVLSAEWIEANGQAVSGLNLTQLRQDLAAL